MRTALCLFALLCACTGPFDPDFGVSRDYALGIVLESASVEMSRDMLLFDFEGEERLAAPGRWQPLAAEGAAVQWSIGGSESPAGSNRFVRTEKNAGVEGEHHLLGLDEFSAGDIHIAARIRARGGKLARGGGLAWGVQDARNYSLAAWDPERGRVSVYRASDGELEELGSLEVGPSSNRWNLMLVRVEETRVEVVFDGLLLLATEDPAPRAGGVALWTAADAVTAFDDVWIWPPR